MFIQDLTIDRCFETVRYARKKDVLEFSLQLLLLLLLHLCDVNEKVDVHFLVHVVDLSQHAVDVLIIDSELRLNRVGVLLFETMR